MKPALQRSKTRKSAERFASSKENAELKPTDSTYRASEIRAIITATVCEIPLGG